MKKRRPYQQEAIERIQAHRERVKGSTQGSRGIVAFATGLGKSYTATQVVADIYPLQTNRVLFVAPSRSLITQMHQNFVTDYSVCQNIYTVNGVGYPGIGMEMGRLSKPDARLIIGSLQTLLDKPDSEEERVSNVPITSDDIEIDAKGNIYIAPGSDRRVLVSERLDAILAEGGMFSVIIFDEAHHAVAKETLRMFARLEEIVDHLGLDPFDVIGLTATPMRADGIGLMNLFDVIYIQRSYKWAQKYGYLVDFATPIRVHIDTKGGQADVKGVLNWQSMVFKTYEEKAKDRQIICFMGPIAGNSGVLSSRLLARHFLENGVRAAHVDGESCISPDGGDKPRDYRETIYDQFRKGDIKIICSYGVGLEGLDLPNADCLFWLRNTDNPVLMTQAVGRILRLSPGKEDALIVDFTGKDIHLMPVGTLFGFKVNVDGDYEEDDELLLDEEDELLGEEEDGLESIFDLMAKGHALGQGTTYSIPKIISKSPGTWYADPNSNALSIGVGTGIALVINPPNYSIAMKYEQTISDVTMALSGEENPYSDANEELRKRYDEYLEMSSESLQEILEVSQYCSELFGKYTMWDMDTRKREPRLPEGETVENSPWLEVGWVSSNDQLSLLMADSVEYAYGLEHTIRAFMDKSRGSWRRKPVKDTQVTFMKSLGLGDQDFENMKSGEAASLITHALAYNPVSEYIDTVRSSLEDYIV